MAVHIPHVPATFIHIPKTAGSAFSKWLAANVPDTDNKSKHCTASEARTIWPDLGFTFCFVRNPWNRMVSYFHFIGQRARTRLADREKGLRVKKTTTPEHDQLLVEYYQQGFRHWLLDLYHSRDNVYELSGSHHNRFTPQWHWAQDVDQAFRVEDLSQTFRDLQTTIGCYQPMPTHNVSEHGPYQEYYQEDTCAMIAEWFDVDIKNFNYDYSQ